MILLSKSKVPKSFKKILSYLNIEETKIIEKHYCNSCGSALEEKFCLNTECSKFNSIIKKFDSFIFVNMKAQIKDILITYFGIIERYIKESKQFVDINHKINYDFNKLILNLLLYSDGVQVTKSPPTSIWPVICGILELPPALRNSNINKIIFGVWYGVKQPNSDILFESFLEQFKDLKLHGIDFDYNNKNHRCFVQIYGFLSYIPPKCMAMGMKYYNGYYSCPYCLIEGNLMSYI